MATEANAFEAAWIDASLAEGDAADDEDYDADALRSAWQVVWAAAESDEQRLIAARGLLLAGGSVEGIEALRLQHPDAMREIDQLAEALYVGPGLDRNATIARLRQLRQGNKFAAARLAELLYAKDRIKESVAVLREAADRFDDQHLRLMAATQLAEAGLLSDAAGDATLALARATPRWPGRQRAHRICLQAAAESADWPQTIAHARQLLAIAEEPEARWALAYALVSEQQPDEAWETIKRPEGLLPAGSKQWAALRLNLLNRYGTRQQVFQDAVLALRRYGTDEQFAAWILANAYAGRVGHAKDDEESAESSADLEDSSEFKEVLAELHRLTDDFLHRFPNSSFRAIRIDNPDDANEIMERIRPLVAAGAEQKEELARKVVAGIWPTGMLATIAGRSYAEACIRRAAGGLQVVSPAAEEVLADQRDVSNYLTQQEHDPDKQVFVDAASLNVLGLLPVDLRDQLFGVHRNLRLTKGSLEDLRVARSALAMRSTLSVGFDSSSGKVVVTESSSEEAELLATRAQQLLDLARVAVVVPTAPSVGPKNKLNELAFEPWLAVIRTSAAHGAALWSDDVALRRLARHEGIQTFSTVALMNALVGTNELQAGTLEEALLELTRNFVVDLPFAASRLRVVASQEGWQPRAAAFALSRPTAWQERSACFGLAQEGCRRCVGDPKAIAGWVAAATIGLGGLYVDHEVALGQVSKLMVALLLERQMTPDGVRAVVAGGRQGARERNLDDPWPSAVTALHAELLGALGEDGSAQALLRLCSALEDLDRLALVQVITDPRR